MNEPIVHQLIHQLVAQSFDIQGATLREMQNRLLTLRGTVQATHATPIGFARFTRNGAATYRTFAVELFVYIEGFAAVISRGRVIEYHTHHFRNHITRTPHHDAVADAHILATNFIFVVQSGVTNRGAADEHRFELRDRCELAGAADLNIDIEHARYLFLCRKFVRDGPTWFACNKAESALQSKCIDFVDHSIDIERQAIALVTDGAMKLDQAGSTFNDCTLRIDRHSHRRNGVKRGAMCRWQSPTLHIT